MCLFVCVRVASEGKLRFPWGSNPPLSAISRFRKNPRMTNPGREQLKDNLRAIIAGRGGGLDLDSPFRWIVEHVKHPKPFIRALPLLLPPDSILYFEGISIAREVSAFYEQHRAPNAVPVTRDTIFPVPEIYHVAFSQDVISALCKFARSRPSRELCDHIKAYHSESLLFTFHDAFVGDPLLSGHLAEPVVSMFCQRLGAVYRREPNVNQRDPTQLQRTLRAIDNPPKIRIAGESLWRRLWRRWTRR